jgi:hypothetical protein
MDKAGYYSVECWGGATFDSCLRYLAKTPGSVCATSARQMPNTRLQMLLRGQNLLGYKHYHDDVVEKVRRAVHQERHRHHPYLRRAERLPQPRHRAGRNNEVCKEKYPCLRLYLLHAKPGAHR